VIQQLFGHADIRSVQTYARIEDATLREAMARFHPRSADDCRLNLKMGGWRYARVCTLLVPRHGCSAHSRKRCGQRAIVIKCVRQPVLVVLAKF
jgi:hypothetical protein